MDNKFYSLTILGGSEPMIHQYAVNSILSCNEETCQYGLVLTVEQAHALVLSRNQSLKASGRIELGGGVIEKLIQSFAGSPYITPENYEETLHRLIDIFYSFKSDTWEAVSDDQLIEFMKDAFDGSCRAAWSFWRPEKWPGSRPTYTAEKALIVSQKSKEATYDRNR